jgi:FlaG/FlaF family flagellin (archaellin)
MKTTTLKPKELKTSHKAVAPVIATLLMVAIAVVGGTIIFVFSQGFFSSSQISGTPQIESLKIEGYDARAVPNLQMHDGQDMQGQSGDADSLVEINERVAVYITNHSVQKVVLGEVWLGGFQYDYVNVNAAAPGGLGLFATVDTSQLRTTNYTVLTGTTGGTADVLLNEAAGEIQAGQTATIILDLESDLRIGRSSQFKITTSNGNVFVGTVSVGQQSG